LISPRVEKGVVPGEYKVVVSKALMPDGSEPDPNVAPMNSPARETLPAVYSNPGVTTLNARVSRENRTFTFALQKNPRGR